MDSECLRNVRLSKNRFKNSYLSSTNFSSDSDSCHSSTRASILEEHADFSHENPLRTAKASFVVSLRSSLLCFKFMKTILSRDVYRVDDDDDWQGRAGEWDVAPTRLQTRSKNKDPSWSKNRLFTFFFSFEESELSLLSFLAFLKTRETPTSTPRENGCSRRVIFK